MRVLVIGYGKMGQIICSALQRNADIKEITVCDVNVRKEHIENGISFISSFTNKQILTFDCAFIATPTRSHLSVMEHLICGGMKNIYVEKPTVLNSSELEKINSISGDCKIVTGYILRHSEPMIALKCILDNLLRENFQMELCSVTYQKHLENTIEPRMKVKMGVFEEIVHVLDLLFNYLCFSSDELVILDSSFEEDSNIKNRIVSIQLSYYTKFFGSNALMRIYSSYLAEEKKREFFFTLVDSNAHRRNILFSFDNVDDFDRLIMTDTNGNILYKQEYPSLLKIDQQIKSAIIYFKTGENNDLCMLDSSKKVFSLVEKLYNIILPNGAVVDS